MTTLNFASPSGISPHGAYERAAQIYNSINGRSTKIAQASRANEQQSLQQEISNLSSAIHNVTQVGGSINAGNILNTAVDNSFHEILKRKAGKLRDLSSATSSAIAGDSKDNVSLVKLASVLTEASINLKEMISVRDTLVEMWKQICSTPL